MRGRRRECGVTWIASGLDGIGLVVRKRSKLLILSRIHALDGTESGSLSPDQARENSARNATRPVAHRAATGLCAYPAVSRRSPVAPKVPSPERSGEDGLRRLPLRDLALRRSLGLRLARGGLLGRSLRSLTLRRSLLLRSSHSDLSLKSFAFESSRTKKSCASSQILLTPKMISACTFFRIRPKVLRKGRNFFDFGWRYPHERTLERNQECEVNESPISAKGALEASKRVAMRMSPSRIRGGGTAAVAMASARGLRREMRCWWARCDARGDTPCHRRVMAV